MPAIASGRGMDMYASARLTRVSETGAPYCNTSILGPDPIEPLPLDWERFRESRRAFARARSFSATPIPRRLERLQILHEVSLLLRR